MADFIPLAVPNVGEAEADRVHATIMEGWVSSVGPHVTRFEEVVCSFTGVAAGVAVSSGTAALYLAMRLQGLQRDEEVLMPSLTFIAPANAVRQHGAWPTFVDVDKEHWQLDPALVDDFLRSGCERSSRGLVNRSTGRRVVGIVPVHLLGHPAPVAELAKIAQREGLWVVEDAAEALGTRTEDGRHVGDSSRLSCLSFNGNKVVTTGGGGMLLSNDEDAVARARHLSTQAKSDPLEYVHSDPAYNFRLTSVQAALGVAQMERASEFVQRKREVAATYRDRLPRLGVEFMTEAPGVFSTWWLPTGLLPAGVDRVAVAKALRTAGIEVRPLWQPLHRSPAMEGCFSMDCSISDRLYERAISLPSSTSITEADLDRVCDALEKILVG